MADEKKPAKNRSENSKAKKGDSKKSRDEPVAGGPRGPGELNPVDVYREFVEQRKGGGAPPTRQAYDAAMEQWRKLPGAVVGVARDIRPVTEPPEEPPADVGEEPPDDPQGESREEGEPS
jgi:hypothetical protein